MTKELPVTADFLKIVVENIPLMDVRAPVEFGAGAFPSAVNLPIMDNDDRHLVGMCYKKHGREAAFKLAFKRVSGTLKQQRIAAWIEYHAKHSHALFYCFRGGMRSKTAQQWFAEETGIIVDRLDGGYKAFRRFLIESMDPAKVTGIPVILGGRTGSGKTILLRQLQNSIDLEAIANHRGSTFGAFLSPQPTQIDFENSLACQLIKHNHRGFRHLVLEDEGSYIGARYIPNELVRYFKRDTVVLLESAMEDRVETIHKEYVVAAQQEFIHYSGEEKGLEGWFAGMQAKMMRIEKRLGGERLKRILDMLICGVEEQRKLGYTVLHKKWIELLLAEYYDPMYDFQIEKSGRKVAFSGGFSEVLCYLRNLEKKMV
jgi:tRNA 2-selenouridine synthase